MALHRKQVGFFLTFLHLKINLLLLHFFIKVITAMLRCYETFFFKTVCGELLDSRVHSADGAQGPKGCQDPEMHEEVISHMALFMWLQLCLNVWYGAADWSVWLLVFSLYWSDTCMCVILWSRLSRCLPYFFF